MHFVTVMLFKNIERKDKSNFGNFYSRSKAEIIINESEVDNLFKSIYTTI